ncbi:regulator of G-protein signaling 14, partial [Carlito syrichta]|uniref:Regulator of G-protein signaling 14 n=1 Tax=Carlito syrichta TaxID=1868482 RepID=A0A3Q0DM62_CARSF
GPQGQGEGRGSSLSVHSLPSGPSSPFPSEEQPVASWAVSFERLLQDPLGLAYFTEFLKKEFSAENVTFWKACERFQQIPASDTQQLAQEARSIYQEFLSSQALSPVNIDRQARLGELGGAANSALRRESQGSLNSSASLDLGFLAFAGSKSESHRKSLGSSEGDSESRPGKYCCVYLPDGTASLALARPGLTIRDMLAGICEKRGLSLPDIKVYLVGNEQALVLDQDCAVLADQEVRLENRITFEGAGGAGRAGPGRARPPCPAADLPPQPGEQQPLDLGKLVSAVAAQRLVLDTLPGAKVSEPGAKSPRHSQGCQPRTQDKATQPPTAPPSSLVKAPSSTPGKRQTCDIEGLVELLNRVQSSGAHDQRGLLRKEDLVLPEFLQLPAGGPSSQEAPPQTESAGGSHLLPGIMAVLRSLVKPKIVQEDQEVHLAPVKQICQD